MGVGCWGKAVWVGSFGCDCEGGVRFQFRVFELYVDS